ncbi:MAG TPA: nuclear transport factor 2 family protein, partial [Intrasporangium sp.]|uniref:nuclear transport factor 2 family protein n=1 Tax=Intrasporangium sp. TaxID=1925024 RepID=UPI002B46D7E7
KASEIYHDDAVLEFPQSGERFRGKANIQGWRQHYHARLDFEPREIRGSGDFWIGEGRLLYDGADPVHFVKILEFRGDKVQRETIYTAEPFPAPDWRKPWAEEGAAPHAGGDLPARIRGGS